MFYDIWWQIFEKRFAQHNKLSGSESEKPFAGQLQLMSEKAAVAFGPFSEAAAAALGTQRN